MIRLMVALILSFSFTQNTFSCHQGLFGSSFIGEVAANTDDGVVLAFIPPAANGMKNTFVMSEVRKRVGVIFTKHQSWKSQAQIIAIRASSEDSVQRLNELQTELAQKGIVIRVTKLIQSTREASFEFKRLFKTYDQFNWVSLHSNFFKRNLPVEEFDFILANKGISSEVELNRRLNELLREIDNIEVTPLGSREGVDVFRIKGSTRVAASQVYNWLKRNPFIYDFISSVERQELALEVERELSQLGLVGSQFTGIFDSQKLDLEIYTLVNLAPQVQAMASMLEAMSARIETQPLIPVAGDQRKNKINLSLTKDHSRGHVKVESAKVISPWIFPKPFGSDEKLFPLSSSVSVQVILREGTPFLVIHEKLSGLGLPYLFRRD